MKSSTIKNKYFLTIIGIVLVIIVGFIITRVTSQQDAKTNGEGSTLPEIEAIPTVDDSVKVKLVPDKLIQRLTLTITGIPDGVKSFEYTLTYEKIQDGEKVLDGAYNKVEFDGEEPYEDVIVLGTESKGAYTYHRGVESATLSIKFDGTKGPSLYENTFEF